MNLEERIVTLETRIECLSMLIASLIGIHKGLHPDLLDAAVSNAANLHNANAPYQTRLTDEQIQRVEAMLKLYLQQ